MNKNLLNEVNEIRQMMGLINEQKFDELFPDLFGKIKKYTSLSPSDNDIQNFFKKVNNLSKSTKEHFYKALSNFDNFSEENKKEISNIFVNYGKEKIEDWSFNHIVLNMFTPDGKIIQSVNN
jgi:hypothetical protein